MVEGVTRSAFCGGLYFQCDLASAKSPRHLLNEDAALMEPEKGLFIVADGMGGHEDGHIASRAVVTFLKHAYSGAGTLEEKISALENGLQAVHATLCREGRAAGSEVVIGSTVVSLLVADTYAVIHWVGDSRLYVWREQELFRLTEDHSHSGGPEGRQNILTRAVGSHGCLDISRRLFAVENGDIFLLCSDGLLKGLAEEQIESLLNDDSHLTSTTLVDRAVVAGSKDDVTALFVRIGVGVEEDLSEYRV